MLLSPHGRSLDLAARTRIVGVINCTPDSFVASSRACSLTDVVTRAERLLHEGADLLEIGGEATGPGSAAVSLHEERRRVLPALKELRRRFPETWIAVDTWKSDIAHEALAAGADLINDVTAGRGDPTMFPVLARASAPTVLMYAKDATPRTTIRARRQRDIIGVVRRFLDRRIDVALRAGIAADRIIVDPGLGHFVSADARDSFALIAGLSRLSSRAPILVSPSRKSFLSDGGRLPPADRLPGTIAASIVAVQNGASLIRTHDVGALRAALDVLAATTSHESRH